MNKKCYIHLLATTTLILWQVQSGMADTLQSATSSTNGKIAYSAPPGMQRYVILIQGCATEFLAKKGGMAKAYIGNSEPYGDFSHVNYFPNFKNNRSLSFSITCRPGKASEVCPKIQPTDPNPENIAYYHERHLSHFHDSYYSQANIYSHPINSSSTHGQGRSLEFCLGDDTRTLATAGGLLIGYDSRDISTTAGKPLQPSAEAALPEILNIIRSIRFISESTKP